MVKRKLLEEGTQYADLDGDGEVSDEEIALHGKLQEQQLQHERADSQRAMCWFALLGLLLYPSGVIFADFFGLDQAAEILGSMASIYMVSVAGIISVFFGSQAIVSKNGSSK